MTRRTTTFIVVERDGAWAVTRDGVLYGDYHSRLQAVASAQLGAHAVEGRGGAACVLLQPNGQVLAH